MKLLLILGFILNIAGYGEVPAEGLELTVTETSVDLLTGETLMELDGTMLCSDPLQVTITRTSEGLHDEFCCAGTCRVGNGETHEELNFTPNGLANWFVHYYPSPGSYETIQYTFIAGGESRTVTIHFDYTAQGMESIQPSTTGTQKIMRDGILYIIKNNQTFTIL